MALTAAVAAVLLSLGGYDPGEAATAAATGAFGSVDAVLSITVVRAVPLVLTGLADRQNGLRAVASLPGMRGRQIRVAQER